MRPFPFGLGLSLAVVACGTSGSTAAVGAASGVATASGSPSGVAGSGASGAPAASGVSISGASGGSGASGARTGTSDGSVSGAPGSRAGSGAGASGSTSMLPGDADTVADVAIPRDNRASCPAGPYLTPAGTNRQNPCATFKFNHNWNEGPVWIASEGAFFFSNFEQDATTDYNGDIIKYTPGAQCEVWLTNVGTNGLGIAPDGNLLATQHLTQTLTEFDLATKQSKVIVDNYMGKKFNSPNDLIVHSNGTIYFTDPDYQRGNRPQQLPTAVYRVDPTGAISVIATGGEPNGISLSPDETRLYVEEDTSGGLGFYDLDTNGVPTVGPHHFSGSTDGIAMDCAGDVYLSAGGGIFNPAGMSIGSIPGGGGTHPTFGGPDGKTLLIVGDPSQADAMDVATVQMNIAGIQ